MRVRTSIPSRAAHLLALLGLLCVGSQARAQSFSELERAAQEAPEDLATFVAPLLADCRDQAGAAGRRCAQARRRSGAALTRGTYIVDLGARGRVSISPYEAHTGGFRIRVPGMAFVREGAPGVVSTAPFSGGEMPPHLLAEGFARVGREAAGRFLAANPFSDLRVRFVFRVGADWVDGSPASPERSYGVALEVLAAQVYNARTGSVLADSLVRSSVQAAGPLMMGRTILWSRETRREAAWLTPEGDTVVFHTRIEPVASQPGTLETTVLTTHGAAPVEVHRFVAPCCSAAVDLRPHGRGVLMIITEVASTGGAAGRGRVLFLRWNHEAGSFDIAARWEGDNRSEPPAWLRDPSALPSEAQ